MVHEYKTLSHTFEEIKAENASLKNSSAKSSSDELEDTDSLKTELSRLKIENELLRNEASELKAVVQALNDMVHEYKTLSHTFEEIKAENASLKNSSAKSSSDELEDTDSLKTELSRLKIENELLRNEASELKAEVDKLTEEMSSWNKASRSLYKLYESQKPLNDKTGAGFNYDSSLGETSTQSQPVHDKLNKRIFVSAGVIHDCLESMRYNDQDTSQPDRKGKGKFGIGYHRSENSKPSWLKNKLNEDRAKAGPKFLVPNQPRHYSRKAKTEWTRNQPRRNPYGQNVNLGETSTQSQPVHDKLNKRIFVSAGMIHDCLESMRYNDQDTSQPDRKGKGKVGIGYQRPENSKPGWLKNKLNEDKAKAGPKFFVPNQPRHYSRKAKTEWTRNQPRRNPYGQNESI
ncbi:hypothetical protein F511_20725 [Dorcoceras hygrometricum]|uniref:Spindle pole body component 110-like n=1 Tax=Dorcoceras hygrometricum TaxID=472368 RepID=A0A2Z7AR11_9LAMI|nr:hypothetical protein F511_20725 [Dorcoceras hygrometricum]